MFHQTYGKDQVDGTMVDDVDVCFIKCAVKTKLMGQWLMMWM